LKNTVQNDLNVEEFHLQKCFEVKTVVLWGSDQLS
jgi:hypothetical protein